MENVVDNTFLPPLSIYAHNQRRFVAPDKISQGCLGLLIGSSTVGRLDRHCWLLRITGMPKKSISVGKCLGRRCRPGDDVVRVKKGQKRSI